MLVCVYSYIASRVQYRHRSSHKIVAPAIWRLSFYSFGWSCSYHVCVAELSGASMLNLRMPKSFHEMEDGETRNDSGKTTADVDNDDQQPLLRDNKVARAFHKIME
jgi:hypothetical protein